MTAHFEHHVNTSPVRCIEHMLHHVALRRIERFISSHFLCQLAPVRIHFSRKKRGASGCSRHRDRHQSDRPRAGHQHVQARNFAGQHGVHRISERIHDCSVVLGNRRIHFPHVARRNPHELREASVRVDSKNFHVLANVRLAHPARSAMPAIHVHLRGHEVAAHESSSTSSPTFSTTPQNSWPKVSGRMNSRGRPTVPAVNVQVRSANRSCAHPHEYVSGSNRGNAYGFKLRAPLRAHLA